jgi:hypothetical protein
MLRPDRRGRGDRPAERVRAENPRYIQAPVTGCFKGA